MLAEAGHAVGALVGSTMIDNTFLAYYAQEIGEEVRGVARRVHAFIIHQQDRKTVQARGVRWTRWRA